MEPKKGIVVGLGGRVPKIRLNINDADYSEKSNNPDNWYPAVLVKQSDETVTCVCVRPEENYKPGDDIWYA